MTAAEPRVCIRCGASVSGIRCVKCGAKTTIPQDEVVDTETGARPRSDPADSESRSTRSEPTTHEAPRQREQANSRPLDSSGTLPPEPKTFVDTGSTRERIEATERQAFDFDALIAAARTKVDRSLGQLKADIGVVNERAARALQPELERMRRRFEAEAAAAAQAHQANLNEHDRRAQIRLAQTANEVKGAALRLRDAAESLEPETAQSVFGLYSDSDTLRATEVKGLATIGFFEFPQASQFDRALPLVPALVPLIDRGHVVIESIGGSPGAPDPALQALVSSLVAQAFASAPPGQIVVTVFNPKSSKLLSGFLATAATTAGLFKVLQPTKEALRQSLNEHLALMVEAEKSIGSYSRMSELIAETGQHEHQYHCLVILDAPTDWTLEAADLLEKIMSAGAAAGVSVILHRDPAGVVDRVVPETLFRHASVLRQVNGTWRLSIRGRANEQYAIRPLPAITQTDQSRLMDVVARGAESGSLPNIEFEQILHRADLSSDAGIKITMGRKGTQSTEFVLGDTTSNIQNVLVGGRAGSGKTNLLKVMIYSMAARYSLEELELFLLDFKEGGDFMQFIGTDSLPPLPNATVVSRDCDATFGIATLRHFEEEMRRRAAVTSTHGVSNIWELRRSTGTVLPRWVLVIDEFQGLFIGGTNREATQILENLVRKGRSFGLHVILATQTLSGVSFAGGDKDRAIFENIAGRIALQLGPGEFGRFMRTDNDEGDQLRYRGQAIFNPANGAKSENQLFVVARADEEHTNKLQHELARRAADSGRPIRPPFVYRGGETVAARDLLRREGCPTVPRRGELPAWFGRESTISSRVASSSLSPIVGSHVLLLGGDEETVGNAIATLQTITLSAIAAADEPIEVLILEALIPQFHEGANLDQWTETLAQMGAIVRLYDADSVTEFVSDIRAASDARRRTVVALLGAENTDFREQANAVGSWKEAIRELPRRNVNLVAYWPDARDIPGDSYALKDDYKTMLFFGKNDQIVSSVTGRSRDGIPELQSNRTVVYSAAAAQDGVISVTAIRPLTEEDFLDYARAGGKVGGSVARSDSLQGSLVGSDATHPAQPVEKDSSTTAQFIENDSVSLRDSLRYPLRAKPGVISLRIGAEKSGFRDVELRNSATFAHLLLLGRIMSGVDQIVHAALHSCGSGHSAADVSIEVIDLMEGGDFREFEDAPLPHLTAVREVTDSAAMMATLTACLDDVRQREAQLNTGEGGTVTPSQRHLIVVNNAGDLPPETRPIIAHLAKIGPNVGVHLFLVAYEPFGVDDGETLRDLLGGEPVLIACALNEADSTSILGSDDAATLRRGREAIIVDASRHLGRIGILASQPADRELIRREIRQRDAGK